jgi:hypothetical protein
VHFTSCCRIACVFLFALAEFCTGCVRTYIPPPISSGAGILVVDGFINAGNDSTYITLSRSAPLQDSAGIQKETNAFVYIEGSDYSLIALPEIQMGTYACAPFQAGTGVQYRLKIGTQNGSQYQSDFVPVQVSPPIDSVSWARTDSGSVTVYVTTHNPIDSEKFYLWTYTETWEFHPVYESYYVVEGGLWSPREDYLSLYTCWHTQQSTNLLLANSSNLSHNIIYENPIEHIVNNSWQISVDYSILVEQQVLSAQAYNYYQVLKQNTELTGSLFDSQPTSINGNIHNVNNSLEPVIGQIYCSTVTEQRIFIHNNQLPNWYVHLPLPNDSCQLFSYGPGDDPAIAAGILIPADLFGDVAEAACADCRLNGTNVMPFWWQ